MSVLSPVYWVTASERGGAKNGLSLTDGKFSRDVQVEYATGKVSVCVSVWKIFQQIFLSNLLMVDG